MIQDYIPQPFDADWPEPDMSVLEPTRPQAPAMSRDALSHVFGPWADWLETAATAKGVPIDYVGAGLLATASGVIGNARWASPWVDWKEPPTLWVMLVGEPSSGKSPALDAVLEPLAEIEAVLKAAYAKDITAWRGEGEIAAIALQQWKVALKSAMESGTAMPPKPAMAEDKPQPVQQRIRVTDVTIEKVAVMLSDLPRGLLLVRDELTGWLGSMERYSSGGGDRPFWLEAYGGRSYSVDRKSNLNPIFVPHLSVAVVGGAQPDKLSRLLVKCDDDGLLARFLTVFPEPVPLSRPKVGIDRGKLVEAFKRLHGLQMPLDETGECHPLCLPFTEAAQERLHEFRSTCRSREEEAHGIFKSHLGKLGGMVVRVSNVLTHLDWSATGEGDAPTAIDVQAVERAIALVGEHYANHAFRAYGSVEAPEAMRAATKLAGLIVRERMMVFSVREVQQRQQALLATSVQIKDALKVLRETDWVRHVKEGKADRYAVNPRIWES